MLDFLQKPKGPRFDTENARGRRVVAKKFERLSEAVDWMGLGHVPGTEPSDVVREGEVGDGGRMYRLVRPESLSYPCIRSQDTQTTGPESGRWRLLKENTDCCSKKRE